METTATEHVSDRDRRYNQQTLDYINKAIGNIALAREIGPVWALQSLIYPSEPSQTPEQTLYQIKQQLIQERDNAKKNKASV